MGIGLSSLEQQMGSGKPSQGSWLKRRSTLSLWVGHSQSLKSLPKSFTPNMVLRLGFCCCKNWNFCFSSQSPIKTFYFHQTNIECSTTAGEEDIIHNFCCCCSDKFFSFGLHLIFASAGAICGCGFHR
jgi:hypothetical protein